jgi:hypothetical protein
MDTEMSESVGFLSVDPAIEAGGQQPDESGRSARDDQDELALDRFLLRLCKHLR